MESVGKENDRVGVLIVLGIRRLVSYRGLFELDDVIHNALGTALGVLIVLGFRRLMKQ